MKARSTNKNAANDISAILSEGTCANQEEEKKGEKHEDKGSCVDRAYHSSSGWIFVIEEPKVEIRR